MIPGRSMDSNAAACLVTISKSRLAAKPQSPRPAAAANDAPAVLQQVTHTEVVRLDARQDLPIGRSGFDDVADRGHGIGQRAGRCHEVVGRTGQGIGNAVGEIGKETGPFRSGIEHDSDHIGLAGLEPDTGAIGAVADPIRYQLDAGASRR